MHARATVSGLSVEKHPLDIHFFIDATERAGVYLQHHYLHFIGFWCHKNKPKLMNLACQSQRSNYPVSSLLGLLSSEGGALVFLRVGQLGSVWSAQDAN